LWEDIPFLYLFVGHNCHSIDNTIGRPAVLPSFQLHFF
jgi:hypothetical protein